MSNKAALAIIVPPTTGMARTWRAGSFHDDAWRVLEDGAPWPKQGSLIVSLARWRDAAGELPAAEGLKVGLALTAKDDLDPAVDNLHRLALIVLTFPKFTDGRAYSVARRLREQWGYRGELRASGDVLFDQLPLMLRCGFDSFTITDAATIGELQRTGLPRPERMYQSPSLVCAHNVQTSRDEHEQALFAAE